MDAWPTGVGGGFTFIVGFRVINRRLISDAPIRAAGYIPKWRVAARHKLSVKTISTIENFSEHYSVTN